MDPSEGAATPVVIDCGSTNCRFGYAGEDAPKSVSCVVGNPKQSSSGAGSAGPSASAANKDYFVGFDAIAQEKTQNLDLSYPMERGVIKNWDDMEKLWRFVYESELHISPEERAVLISDAPLNPKQNREKITQIMFENLNVPALYVASQAVLGLYAAGRTSGMVVDVGDQVTYCVPILEGYSLPHTVVRMDLAGRDIQDYLSRMLSVRGISLPTESLRDLKHQNCFVSEDFASDSQKAEHSTEMQKDYALPDGKTISINAERFKATEILFNPTMLGFEKFGIPLTTYHSINKTDKELQKELYGNIILCGGSSQFTGFETRLRREIAAMVPANVPVKVLAIPERQNSAWLGGSILAHLTNFDQMWIAKREYDDSGPSIVHRKCF